MSTAIFLNEDLILSKVTEKSFERGEDYYNDGMVESLVRRGSRLFAEVLGSEDDPYHVGVYLQEDDFSASCTCPYDWGGYCKHIVAVCLTWMHDRDAVEARAPIEDLLSKLDVDILKEVILQLVESNPRLSKVIDEFVAKVPAN